MSPFRFIVLAFRAAVRTEVDRAMADRRRALQAQPDDDELRALLKSMSRHGLTVLAVDDDRRAEHLPIAEILPFPVANDRHVDPPSPAA